MTKHQSPSSALALLSNCVDSARYSCSIADERCPVVFLIASSVAPAAAVQKPQCSKCLPNSAGFGGLLVFVRAFCASRLASSELSPDQDALRCRDLCHSLRPPVVANRSGNRKPDINNSPSGDSITVAAKPKAAAPTSGLPSNTPQCITWSSWRSAINPEPGSLSLTSSADHTS